MAWLRLILAFLVLELAHLARARLPGGAWLPDITVALTVALALAGKPRVVLSAGLALCLLRAPATLDDPLASTAAILGFAMFLLETRRFYARERPPIAFLAGALGMLVLAFAAAAANGARGAASAGALAALPAAVTTGLAVPAILPALRSWRVTRRLFERRFGE